MTGQGGGREGTAVDGNFLYRLWRALLFPKLERRAPADLSDRRTPNTTVDSHSFRLSVRFFFFRKPLAVGIRSCRSRPWPGFDWLEVKILTLISTRVNPPERSVADVSRVSSTARFTVFLNCF